MVSAAVMTKWIHRGPNPEKAPLIRIAIARPKIVSGISENRIKIVKDILAPDVQEVANPCQDKHQQANNR